MEELEREEATRAAAELELLERYNAARVPLGHDFGNGARYGELSRRRRELERLELEPGELSRLVAELELGDMHAAYDRVGARRDRRAQADAERYGSRGAQKTAQAWRKVRAWYARPAASS